MVKNSEFNVFDEYQRTNENINFQAIQYSVSSKETYIQKDEVLRTNEENLLNNSNKKISSKTDTSIVKKLIQNLLEVLLMGFQQKHLGRCLRLKCIMELQETL